MNRSKQTLSYFDEFIKITNLLKIVNKAFIRNFFILISLLFFPLFTTIISFFSSNSVITFNQSFISIISIDLFVIGFVVIPVFFKIYQNSLVVTFANKPFDFIRKIFFVLLIYYFFIAILSLLYSVFIIFLFGLKRVDEQIFYWGTLNKITTYNDLIFSNSEFSSPDLGVESHYSPNWGFTALSLLLSYIYYFSFGFLISLLFRRNKNYWTVVTFISLISIINGALLISIENIRQYFVYELFSFFSVSIYPVILVQSFWLGGNPFTDIKNIYSSIDIDFEYKLTYQWTSILSFLIVLIVIMSFFLIYLFLFLERNLYYFFDRFGKKKNSMSPNNLFNSIEIQFSIISLFRENKRNLFDLSINKSEHSFIDIGRKDQAKIINRINSHYILNSPFIKRKHTSIVLLESSVNHTPEISNQVLFNILKSKMNDNQIEWVNYCYENLKQKVNYNKKEGKAFNEYILLLSYLLVANDSFLLIELFYKINNYDVFEFIKYVADQFNKTIVIIGDNKKNNSKNLFQLK